MNKTRFSKLRARIREKNYTIAEIAKLLGMTISTFSLKLNCESDFRLSEIDKLCELLDIDTSEKWEYF